MSRQCNRICHFFYFIFSEIYISLQSLQHVCIVWMGYIITSWVNQIKISSSRLAKGLFRVFRDDSLWWPRSLWTNTLRDRPPIHVPGWSWHQQYQSQCSHHLVIRLLGSKWKLQKLGNLLWFQTVLDSHY